MVCAKKEESEKGKGSGGDGGGGEILIDVVVVLCYGFYCDDVDGWIYGPCFYFCCANGWMDAICRPCFECEIKSTSDCLFRDWNGNQPTRIYFTIAF